jgi:DNA-binding MarR family transcriptional regulator
MTDIIPLLVALRKLDNARLTARDVLVMEALRERPGMMGRELSAKIGMKTRSNVQDSIRRLILNNMIEDRRAVFDGLHNRTPNDLYLLPAGEKFLNELVPQYSL